MATNLELVFVGGYTGDKGGAAEGIVVLRRDTKTGVLTRLGLAARTASPSFLAQHPTLPVLYAVNELTTSGTVSAFIVAADGELTALSVRPTGGSNPAHLTVTADGRFVLVANYSSGSVSVHPVESDGALAESCDLLELVGHGPDAERQEGPHAHHVHTDGADVLITDLGSDRVWRARLDPVSGRLSLGVPAVVAEPGTGPRHLVRSPDGAVLLAGELASNLSWYRPAPDGSLALVGVAATTQAANKNFPSELTMGRDGRFVYVANRGANTVATFAWDGTTATLISEVATGGVWPRHLVRLGDYLYVANQESHTVTTFRIEPATGIPQAQGEPTAESSPTCLLRWAPVAASVNAR